MPPQRNNKKNDSERRFGVILEDMNSKFSLVLEGHSALSVEIKTLGRELKSEIHDLKMGQRDVLEYLSRIDDEIKDLKTILTQKADLQRLQNLEERVAHMELAVKKWQK